MLYCFWRFLWWFLCLLKKWLCWYWYSYVGTSVPLADFPIGTILVHFLLLEMLCTPSTQRFCWSHKLSTCVRDRCWLCILESLLYSKLLHWWFGYRLQCQFRNILWYKSWCMPAIAGCWCFHDLEHCFAENNIPWHPVARAKQWNNLRAILTGNDWP